MIYFSQPNMDDKFTQLIQALKNNIDIKKLIDNTI